MPRRTRGRPAQNHHAGRVGGPLADRGEPTVTLVSQCCLIENLDGDIKR